MSVTQIEVPSAPFGTNNSNGSPSLTVSTAALSNTASPPPVNGSSNSIPPSISSFLHSRRRLISDQSQPQSQTPLTKILYIVILYSLLLLYSIYSTLFLYYSLFIRPWYQRRFRSVYPSLFSFMSGWLSRSTLNLPKIEIKKKPQHISLMIEGSSEPEFHDLIMAFARTVQWTLYRTHFYSHMEQSLMFLSMIGVPYLSLYCPSFTALNEWRDWIEQSSHLDTLATIKKIKENEHSTEMEKRCPTYSFIWKDSLQTRRLMASLRKTTLTIPKSWLHLTLTSNLQQNFKMRLIGPMDGHASLARLSLRKSDPCLTTSNDSSPSYDDFPEPELLIVTGKRLSLTGYPPLSLRFTEIRHIPCLYPVTVDVMISSLHHYSNCQQNFGV